MLWNCDSSAEFNPVKLFHIFESKMWLNLKTNLKPKSINSLVFVVVYCLIFILPNVCHSDTSFTSNVPISDTYSPKNKTQLLVSESPPLRTPTAETTATTTIETTTTIQLTAPSARPSKASTSVAKEAPTKQSSIINKLSTIRPNATKNNVKITNGSNGQRTSTSTTLNTEKVDISRNSKSKPKQKQTSSLSQQQPQYKVSSWPSKPSGTYLSEGDF